ncbi:MAG: Dihydrolipoamide acetyltransferase, partial [Myxococcales bacterium]|nr:Dihydrolipoamide acetyltransferase [Myxococcales bacterium]
MHARSTFAILLASLVPQIASAQPAPPANNDVAYAKSLMQSGVKLLEAKDYLGALAVFKDAYSRLQSAKILLNIGTTLKLLDRRADAANAYQHYLISKDSDPARHAEVTDVLADLDKSVGRLEVSVTPADAEVKFTDEWVPASSSTLWRVPPGSFTVQARKDGFKPDSKTANIAAGEKTAIVISLEAIPAAVSTPVFITAPRRDDLEVTVPVDVGPRSRFGAIAGVHVSVVPRVGSAWRVGGT